MKIHYVAIVEPDDESDSKPYPLDPHLVEDWEMSDGSRRVEFEIDSTATQEMKDWCGE